MVTIDDLQGSYDITYQSNPQLDGWYEPGIGAAKIEGTKLTGIDGVGAIWNADFQISDDGSIAYNATVDPSNAAPNAGLINRNGQMTRDIQAYCGIMNITKSENILILRTSVQQGPITIDVQFRKKA